MQGRAFAVISCEISALVPVNTSPEKVKDVVTRGRGSLTDPPQH